jgi:hypothetical protein
MGLLAWLGLPNVSEGVACSGPRGFQPFGHCLRSLTKSVHHGRLGLSDCCGILGERRLTRESLHRCMIAHRLTLLQCIAKHCNALQCMQRDATRRNESRWSAPAPGARFLKQNEGSPRGPCFREPWPFRRRDHVARSVGTPFLGRPTGCAPGAAWTGGRNSTPGSPEVSAGGNPIRCVTTPCCGCPPGLPACVGSDGGPCAARGSPTQWGPCRRWRRPCHRLLQEPWRALPILRWACREGLCANSRVRPQGDFAPLKQILPTDSCPNTHHGLTCSVLPRVRRC